MTSKKNKIDINCINAMGTKVITQVTFSSVIVLGLMSFIIPSELTLASTHKIDLEEEMNHFDSILDKRVDDLEHSRERRGIDDEYGNDYDSENNFQNTYGKNLTYDTSDTFSMFPTVQVKPERDPWASGPMKTISDSVFSLIILIYVSVIFVFMFFAFCWKEPEPPPPDPAHKNIPMITSMLDEMEKQMEENKRAEEERISIEKDNGSIGKECTEMTEFKNGIDKSKYDSTNSINQSKSITLKSTKELENNSAAISRKDAETIVVNVITEKSKSSTSVNFKEEQV